MLVHVGEALQDLVEPVADARLWQQLVAVLHHLVQIAVEVLKDKVELVVLADDLFELDDGGVRELAQRGHLAQRHALLPAVEFALHLLDRHLRARARACWGLLRPEAMDQTLYADVFRDVRTRHPAERAFARWRGGLSDGRGGCGSMLCGGYSWVPRLQQLAARQRQGLGIFAWIIA